MDEKIESLENILKKLHEILEDTNYIQTNTSDNDFIRFDVYKRLNNIKNNVNGIQNIYDEIKVNIYK